jgi:cyclopropane fatty-acyl-phospholipid synthase-like methyltransferase
MRTPPSDRDAGCVSTSIPPKSNPRADSGREWSDPERVSEYLGREIPHRRLAEELLLEGLPGRVDRVLDLGTGDGRLLRLVLNRHPGARGIGLDISTPMLHRACERFNDAPTTELHLHDLAGPFPVDGPFDAIVSGFAIHHLEHDRKRSLFTEVHDLLAPGGTFVNLDLASSPTLGLHRRFREAIGRPEDDPSDRLAPLEDQLDWLREAGFRSVDCRFKWMELALFVCG